MSWNLTVATEENSPESWELTAETTTVNIILSVEEEAASTALVAAARAEDSKRVTDDNAEKTRLDSESTEADRQAVATAKEDVILLKNATDQNEEKTRLYSEATAADRQAVATAKEVVILAKNATIENRDAVAILADSANKERRADFVANTSYMGKAVGGSLESSPVWNIKKIVVSQNGTSTVTTATNVAWTDRLTSIYI